MGIDTHIAALVGRCSGTPYTSVDCVPKPSLSKTVSRDGVVFASTMSVQDRDPPPFQGLVGVLSCHIVCPPDFGRGLGRVGAFARG